jgi:hypothetical protein
VKKEGKLARTGPLDRATFKYKVTTLDLIPPSTKKEQLLQGHGLRQRASGRAFGRLAGTPFRPATKLMI